MFITGKTKITFFSYLVAALFSLIGYVSPPIFAQTQDTLFEEDSLDFLQEDGFTDDLDLNEIDLESQFDLEEDPTQDSLETPIEEGFGPAPNQEDQYFDEDVLSDGTHEALESALLERQDFFVAERANFVPNILYGVGTGLIIGGWLALLSAKTSRDTLRSIGLGIVLGGVMGSVIGGRSVITPDAPRPQEVPAEDPAPQGKLLPPKTQGLTVSFQWSF